MSLSAQLVDRHFDRKDGELCVGGVPVSRIAEQYGTPLFVYDRAVLKKKLELYRV